MFKLISFGYAGNAQFEAAAASTLADRTESMVSEPGTPSARGVACRRSDSNLNCTSLTNYGGQPSNASQSAGAPTRHIHGEHATVRTTLDSGAVTNSSGTSYFSAVHPGGAQHTAQPAHHAQHAQHAATQTTDSKQHDAAHPAQAQACTSHAQLVPPRQAAPVHAPAAPVTQRMHATDQNEQVAHKLAHLAVSTRATDAPAAPAARHTNVRQQETAHHTGLPSSKALQQFNPAELQRALAALAADARSSSHMHASHAPQTVPEDSECMHGADAPPVATARLSKTNLLREANRYRSFPVRPGTPASPRTSSQRLLRRFSEASRTSQQGAKHAMSQSFAREAPAEDTHSQELLRMFLEDSMQSAKPAASINQQSNARTGVKGETDDSNRALVDTNGKLTQRHLQATSLAANEGLKSFGKLIGDVGSIMCCETVNSMHACRALHACFLPCVAVVETN